jgi:hypothetical protein
MPLDPEKSHSSPNNKLSPALAERTHPASTTLLLFFNTQRVKSRHTADRNPVPRRLEIREDVQVVYRVGQLAFSRPLLGSGPLTCV